MDDLAVFAQSLRHAARTRPENNLPPIVQQVRNKVQDLYTDLSGEVDAAAQTRELQVQSLEKDISAYLAALHDLVRFTTSDDLAFSAVNAVMPSEHNQNAPQAPLALAAAAMHAVNVRLNPNPAQDSPVYALCAGPMDFFRQRLMNGASCRIQAMWEGTVLAKAGTLAPPQLQQGLFAAPGGVVRDFADTTLAYFLNHTLNGYEPEKLSGQSIPFTADFLAFLNAGLGEYKPARDEYGLTIAALPVDVNDGAEETPYAVELSLHCAREKQELVNYNSPSSALFTWNRNTCGDTRLTIRFKTVVLDVLYAGENGFLNFLNDFQYGAKTFKAENFPGQEAVLKKIGVSDITLKYQLSGAEDILNSHRFAPGMLPFVAAECKR
jgi:hypothetical protein